MSRRKRREPAPPAAPPPSASTGPQTPDRPARRSATTIVVLAAAAAALAGGVAWYRAGGSRAAIVERVSDQNVLLVTIDTLRADAIGAGTGPGRAPTPTIDGLARRGARFDFAHAQAVVTLPSHTSILTGRFPFDHGVRDNNGFRLGASMPTLATRLKAQGFATAAFVGAYVLDSRFGLDAGFDRYDDRLQTSDAPTDISIPERRAEAVVALAREWLAAHRGGRWFLWVHVFDPHAPYDPPAPFNETYRDRPYAGEVAYTDGALAPLLADVDAIADRPTLVVLTGDHGEALGDHGEMTHGLFAYEPTLHVPLVMAQVGSGRRAEPAAVSAAPVRHVDIVPTVLDALGMPAAEGLPGWSLLQTLDGHPAADTTSYFEALTTSLNRGWAPLRGVVVGRDKFIDLPVPEVYDLARDAAEAHNLFDADPVRRRPLQATLSSLNAALPGERQAESPEVLRRLRALGYVAGNDTAPRRTEYGVEDDPKRLVEIELQIHRGVELIERGRLDEASRVYGEIIAARPDIAVAYRHLGYIHWRSGDAAGAIAVLKGAIARGLTSPDLRAQLGTYLSETGAAPEAVALLEDQRTADPPDEEALRALGMAYARSGRPGDALQVFDRVLAAAPDDAMALQNAGAALLTAGDAARARERFQKAIAVDAALAPAYTGLGVAEASRGDIPAAIAAWRRAVELDPREFDAMHNLALALLRTDPTEARPVIERFVREAPRALYGPDIAELERLLSRR
ncbi:MAG: sulfatase-like hydrolase/transferase [Vicinamibacterales bacterium]